MRKRAAKEPRRPKRGRYACGDKVRTRIVLAAAKMFATQGYKAASTRRIAAAAGVNTQALHYYFGGKAGLHNACGRQCCDWFEDALYAELSRAKRVVDTRNGREAIAALRSLLEAMLEHTQNDKQAFFWSRFLGRLQTDRNGPAAATVRERILQSLFRPCCGLVALIQGRPDTDGQVHLTAMLLIALPATFSSAQGGALWRAHGKLSRHSAAAIVRQMFNHQVLAAINGPVVAKSAADHDARASALVLPLRRPLRST